MMIEERDKVNIKFDFEDGLGPVEAHRHLNGDLADLNLAADDLTEGGWVAKSANVHSTVFVGPDARIYGKAKVTGYARIYGHARVLEHAEVYDNAEVYDHARIYGTAHVYGDALVFGNARVAGQAKVFEKAKIYDDAWVSGYARVSEDFKIDRNNALLWRANQDNLHVPPTNNNPGIDLGVPVNKKGSIDRFDFEQDIFKCWHIVDDIDHLGGMVLDRGASVDDISNVLLGLHTLYNDRFQKLMDDYEELVHDEIIR